MKHHLSSLLFSVLIAALVPLGLHAQRPAVSNDNEDGVYKLTSDRPTRDFVPGQVLVKFNDLNPARVTRAKGRFRSAGNDHVDAILQRFGVTEMSKLFPQAEHKAASQLRRAKAPNGSTVQEQNLDQIYMVEAQLSYDSTLQLVEALSNLPQVEYAEPNYKVYIMGEPADTVPGGQPLVTTATQNPLYSQQWYLRAEGANYLWGKPVVNTKRPIIGIIDTGVDITHPDLAENVWVNSKEADGEPGYDDDADGFVDDEHGWDFVNNTGKMRDNNSHGTHVAGIAAAADNGVGIIGANPKAIILPVTVMQSDGTGDIATCAKGIDYAVAHGATVLNMSWGGYFDSRTLRDALGKAYQTAVLVAAAGNERKAIYPECNPVWYGTFFPAGYSFVLGVHATTQSGNLASFSNYDCDGPNYSAESNFQNVEGFNYELSAPGVSILSSVPGGKYAYYSGTSMASPLVAGTISALRMVKQYDSQENLWGDLTHSATVAAAYDINKREPELDLLGLQIKPVGEPSDTSYAALDNEIDAGETVSIYPVMRTTFGDASNVKFKLTMGDYEDSTVVTFITPEANFGSHISAYGRNVSKNPVVLKVSPNCADGRHITLKLFATADGVGTIGTEFEFPFTIIASNVRKIGGMISKDTTLTADHVWRVTKNLAVPEGVTLTIEPGTTVDFAKGASLSCSGHLVAKGLIGKMINFTCSKGDIGIKNNAIYIDGWQGISARDTLEYCNFQYVYNIQNHHQFLKNCVISKSIYSIMNRPNAFQNCNIINNFCNSGFWGYISWEGSSDKPSFSNINIVNNYCGFENNFPDINDIGYSNFFNNSRFLLGCYSSDPRIIVVDSTVYLGTSIKSTATASLVDISNSDQLSNPTFAQFDLTNLRTTPIREAHGIVWKVCVDGYDAQDEFEQLPPLGVGKHKFEVYFNRPMNVNKAPVITMGVRDPYTQVGINENGSWSNDSTVYTAYLTITGKTKTDGLNRIYVRDAEDNEFFEIPFEKTRFNVQVNSAGSMATGFEAEAGRGKVDLKWNNEHNDFTDAMGFNLYRMGEPYMHYYPEYWDKNGNWHAADSALVADTVRINQQTLDVTTTTYTDYDVQPGKTYYYLYRVLSTDLVEYDASNVVAATVLTSTRGDANGDGKVDVADVVTAVNWATGQDPKPFIFEAADMNDDKDIDILDVIGIIQVINGIEVSPTDASVQAVASYSIDADGTVWVESPVALAGVQVQLSTQGRRDITVCESLKGFEQTSNWFSDNDYLFLAYNLAGKTLPAGRHAILKIGDSQLTGMTLADAKGRRVEVVDANTNGVTDVTTTQPVKVKMRGIYNVMGQKLADDAGALTNLPTGIYIVNGQKVVK